LAPDPARPRRLPPDPERSRVVAARPAGLLGGLSFRGGAATPPLRAPGDRLRPLRVGRARGPADLAALGARLPPALRGGRRPLAHALACVAELEGRISDRGDARAARRAGDGRRLGPVAGAPAGAGRAQGPESALAGRVHAHRGAADLLSRELSARRRSAVRGAGARSD